MIANMSYFWSSGKYNKAKSVGSKNAASAVTNASLLSKKPTARLPRLNCSAESSTKRKAVLILFPTISVITMLPISWRSCAIDCRVNFADVNCSIVRTRSNASTSQSCSFNPGKETAVTPFKNFWKKIDASWRHFSSYRWMYSRMENERNA